MIRSGRRFFRILLSSSHRRGNDSFTVATMFVPTSVHPTGVGMIRVYFASTCGSRSSSHRRGSDSA